MTSNRCLTLEPPFKVPKVIVIAEEARADARPTVDGGSDKVMVACVVLGRRSLGRG